MPRGPAYTPANCPWASMAARGLVSTSQASAYRRGASVPGASLLRAMRSLGYPVEVVTGPSGQRRAACSTWPDRLPEWAAPVLADCGWEKPRGRVLDEAVRAVLISGQLGDWHAEVLSVAPDGTPWPRAIVIGLPSRDAAESAVLAQWEDVQRGR